MSIHLRVIDPDLHATLKSHAALARMTLQDYIIKLLEQAAKTPPKAGAKKVS